MVRKPIDGLTEAQDTQFKVLQQHFVAGLSKRWAEIAAAHDQSALQSALHRLAGSAGAYGFEALGRYAHKAYTLSQTHEAKVLAQELSLLREEIDLVMGHRASSSAGTEAPGSSQSGDN